jgi:lipase chaperone LimK
MTIKEKITQELEKLPEPVLQEVLDFVEFLKTKQQKKMLEITIMSESSLAKDWLKPEEDAAWQNL